MRRRDAVFPWLLALAVTVPAGIIVTGTERELAIGASIALVLGAATCAWLVRAERRHYEARERAIEQRLRTDSESRAAALVRQFGWSVDEVVVLRGRLQAADARLRAAAERTAALDVSVDAAQRESNRARQAVFELAAVDVRELREARDAADLAREAAERRAEHADQALRVSQRQLAAAHQRVRDLTELFASISTARELVKSGSDEDDVSVAGSSEITWTLLESAGMPAIEVRSSVPPNALRLRGPAGATILVKRLDRRERMRKTSTFVRIMDEDIAAGLESEPEAFAVQVLVDGKWHAAAFDPAGTLTDTDRRDRVWSRRAPVVHIAG